MQSKHIFLGLTALIFLGCSPKYEIKTHFNHPSDLAGKQCVQTASIARKNCQSRCNQSQGNCRNQAEQTVRNNFPNLMNTFQGLSNQYNHEMERYDIEMNAWGQQEEKFRRDFEFYQNKCNHGPQNSYECRRAHEADDELHNIQSKEPRQPARPVEPNINNEIKKTQASCSNECGCDKEYEKDFVSCGGTLSYEKFCVENCD